MSEHFGHENAKVESKEKPPMHVFIEVGTNQLPVTFMGEKRFGGENDMYIGIDVKKKDVVMAKQVHEFGPEGQHATFVQANAEQLPLKDESAEEMFFGNVFGDPSIDTGAMSTFLSEAERVLKQGGQLIIKETNTPIDIEELRNLLSWHHFREEKVITTEDKNWKEELRPYEKIPFGAPDAYIMYLRKMAEAIK